MIEIIKQKPIKSSTSVEGIIVQVTGGQWYGITVFQPARNPWLGRCGKSSSTGRMYFGFGTELFQTRFKEKLHTFSFSNFCVCVYLPVCLYVSAIAKLPLPEVRQSFGEKS